MLRQRKRLCLAMSVLSDQRQQRRKESTEFVVFARIPYGTLDWVHYDQTLTEPTYVHLEISCAYTVYFTRMQNSS